MLFQKFHINAEPERKRLFLSGLLLFNSISIVFFVFIVENEFFSVSNDEEVMPQAETILLEQPLTHIAIFS
jgi:hypothetical protein